MNAMDWMLLFFALLLGTLTSFVIPADVLRNSWRVGFPLLVAYAVGRLASQ